MEEKKTMGAAEGEVRQEENNVMKNVTETDESVNSQTDAKKQTACSKWGRACKKTVKFFCRHYCKIIGVAALLVMIAFAVMWLMRFAVDIRESFGDLFDIAGKSDFDAERISDNLVYYDHYGYDNKGYVCDNNGRKLIRHIMWIKKAEGDEAKTAPVCYYNGKSYGYFHPVTGKVIVKPVWEKAWEFSEGLAAVNDKGYIKFIDTTGKVVIDGKFPYQEEEDYYFFKGRCVMNDNGKYGIIDRNGAWIVAPEYSDICTIFSPNDTMLLFARGIGEHMVMTLGLDTVLPFKTADMTLMDSVIKVVFPNHTVSTYSHNGELLQASLVRSVEQMYYDTKEVYYYSSQESDYDEYGDGIYKTVMNTSSRQAVAGCYRYEAEEGWYGLMDADGRQVTLPLYSSIKAVDKNLYLCVIGEDEDEEHGVLLDGNGWRVK
ncbi:MAG: WG repeat-containing protein [Bacteroidales bacterium]|nr:WG repeat-containing protein [Bacteroidales bacterium]